MALVAVQGLNASALSAFVEGLDIDRVRPIRMSEVYGGQARSFCGVYSLYQAVLIAGRQSPSLARLVDMTHCEGGECSALDLANAARELGFAHAAVVRLSPEEIRSLTYPAIAFVRDPSERHGHFILLARGAGSQVQIVDFPRFIGWVPVSRLSEFSDSWRGEFVVLDCPSTSVHPLQAGMAGAGSVLVVWSGLLVWRYRRGARRPSDPASSGRRRPLFWS